MVYPGNDFVSRRTVNDLKSLPLDKSSAVARPPHVEQTVHYVWQASPSQLELFALCGKRHIIELCIFRNTDNE